MLHVTKYLDTDDVIDIADKILLRREKENDGR